jgi:hypothetical protein
MGKMVGAEIFDKLEPEPHKNGPAPQHCTILKYFKPHIFETRHFCFFMVTLKEKDQDPKLDPAPIVLI